MHLERTELSNQKIDFEELKQKQDKLVKNLRRENHAMKNVCEKNTDLEKRNNDLGHLVEYLTLENETLKEEDVISTEEDKRSDLATPFTFICVILCLLFLTSIGIYQLVDCCGDVERSLPQGWNSTIGTCPATP